MNDSSLNSKNAIIENYHNVQERIKNAAESVSRNFYDITLIVVTKTHSFETIKPLVDIGHIDFGENRVQEADIKWSPYLGQFPNIKLHLIGHLQSNKAKRATQLFNSIHTIDSQKLVNELEKHIESDENKCKEFFLEINMANEEQKSGISIEKIMSHKNHLNTISKLSCDGLMCIPPYEEEPSPHFLLLNKLSLKYGFSNLSMGMSADFEKAIQFGATHVRVGSEIFGQRQ